MTFRILPLALVVLGLVLPGVSLAAQSTPAASSQNLFSEDGRGLRDARTFVDGLADSEPVASASSFSNAIQAHAWLVLAQDYRGALSALSYLEKQISGNPGHLTTLGNLLASGAGRVPASAFATPWEFLLQIPALHLQLGNVLSAKLWLSENLANLTTAREVASAAVLLVSVLASEARYDQARTLLEQRFLQPLRAGELRPFADRALMIGYLLAETTNNNQLKTELVGLLDRHFAGSPAQLFVKDRAKVGVYPSPYFLLPALDSIALGMLEYRPMGVTPASVGSGAASTAQASTAEGTAPAVGPIAVPETTAVIAATNQSRFIQIGSFQNRANADRIVALARDRGFDARIVSEGSTHRALVEVGNQDVQVLLIRLKEAGIEGFRVDG